METTCKEQHRPGLDYIRLLCREDSKFSCILNKGPSNVPTSCTKKVEAGLCRKKNTITTIEAARQQQRALVLVVHMLYSAWAQDHAHCNGFITR